MRSLINSASNGRVDFLDIEIGILMLRLLFIALAFLSGAVALSHELLWTRRLVDLLGATEAVTGRVLGLFFLGLSLGGWLATRWSKSDGNWAIRLGIAEISIAVLSLPAIFLPLWADSLVSTLGTDLLVSWQGELVKGILTAGVVLPPAIAMGTTMPMFIQVITDLGGTLRSGGIWIYSLNMLGGVFGLWLVSTVLLELAGVRGAMFVAAAGNLLIGLISFACSSRIGNGMAVGKENEENETSGETAPPQQQELEPESTLDSASGILHEVLKFKYVFALAFGSGAIVLASEVLILRLLALVSPSSIQTTSALLANVILFLAIGSIAVALLNRFRISSHTQLIIGAVGAALFCALCPLILYQVTNQLVSVRYLMSLDVSRGGWGGEETIGSIGHYWWILFTIIAWSSGAAMFFFGLVFPSILSIHSTHDPKGRSVGLLLAINGLGGLMGAEFANLLLVFQIGIYRGFVILAAATALATIAACLFNHRNLAAAAIAIGAFLVTLSSAERYQELQYLSPKLKQIKKIEETCFGREGVLMVTKSQSNARSILMNSQYILGSSGVKAEASERRQLLIPWLLHPQSEKVCCLGFATGISASGLEALDSPPEVTAIELSETVVEVAREYFGDQHLSFFERPGNRVLLEDARTYMACADNEYDLIVADLFRPHGAGESRLFSLEHFRNVKGALRDQGLFCQWLPAHQLNQSQFETIANTFLKVFPNTLVVNGSDSFETPTIGLCGWQNDKPWEKEDLVIKVSEIRKQKGISDILSLNAQLLIVGTLEQDAYLSAPVNTLDNALLEIDAGKFWITKDLRSGRTPDNLENGFLSGASNWRQFMLQLYEDTQPILNPIHRQEYFKWLEAQRNQKVLRSKKNQ